ncbi:MULTISPECIES: sugar kinase [unclassified Curtobacterium]|uniref:sugar kinase n=1 Tax=unclassified Curtobacterium TaxID=257496 RepID=UPI00104C6C66|nr:MULTISPECIES: sugar kinase [unclassified Curtobacterium]TCL77758.1 2-dehydro-3-deoxygluconokinase [Curtobacterium sp. PhB128]TCL94340.1 2-dehydro-3-deoxygluconokinase [Curtobacterium sp. PhB138]
MTGTVLTFGETMLLLTGRDVGAVPDLEHMRVDTGGAESNVAIGLVRAGVPATWIGRVGTDPAGDRVAADIGGEGVDVLAVPDAERSTGIMMKERLLDGRTRVTYHRRGSAGSALAATDLPRSVVETAALVHVTGITLALSESAHDTVTAALDRAAAAGVPVSFDVNHRPKLIGADAARDRYRAVAARSAVVFAGDDEARLVLDRDEQDDDEESLAHDLAALARGRAVVKLGSRGAVASIDGVFVRRPATPVRVVDPVGAGDAFVAGWLAASMGGADAAEALDRAADAGALACTVESDWRRPDPAALHHAPDPSDTDHTVHDHVDR